MVKKYWRNAIAYMVLSLGMLTVVGNQSRAESPETLPDEIKETISAIEEAANSQDLEKLTNFYNVNFTNNDGLTVDLMSQALEKTWSTYPRLRYRTTIESWAEEDDNLVVETLTRMDGSKIDQGRNITLVSTVRSRQVFQDKKNSKSGNYFRAD